MFIHQVLFMDWKKFAHILMLLKYLIPLKKKTEILKFLLNEQCITHLTNHSINFQLSQQKKKKTIWLKRHEKLDIDTNCYNQTLLISDESSMFHIH